MRRCSKCGIEKPADEFAVRKDRADGRATVCLACHRVYARAHCAANGPYYLEKAARARRQMRSRNLEALLAYLRTHPCVDCGETDVRVLQFDHIDPSTKIENISELLRDHPWNAVLTEISKCAIRCANCHRRKTLRERDFAVRRRRLGEEDGAWALRSLSDNWSWAVSSGDRAALF